MSERDQALMSFLAIFEGMDPSKAIPILEATDWNVEAAVELQMAAGNTSLDDSSIGGGAGGGADTATNNGGGGINSNNGGAGGYDYPGEDEVRAPIPAQETVLNEPMMPSAGGIHGGVFGGLMQRGGATGGPSFGEVVDSAVMRSFRNFSGEAERMLQARNRNLMEQAPGGARGQELRGNAKLTELFKPPVDVLTTGRWSEIRHVAEYRKQWIIANVQDMSNFDSQRLNRDTWKSETIKDVIKHNFVFWQAYVDSPLGQEFIGKYKSVTEYPAIVVVDGRTGMLVEKWVGFIDPEDLLTKLLAILEKHDDDMSAFRATGEPQGSGGGAEMDIPGLDKNNNDESGHLSKKPRNTEMSEDEALAAAIAASLAETGGHDGDDTAAKDSSKDNNINNEYGNGNENEINDDNDGDDDNLYGMDENAGDDAKEDKPIDVPPPPVIPDEPAQGAPDTTRLQLRLPDGSKKMRRFNKSDTLSTVFGFARLSDPEALEKGRLFDLVITSRGTAETEVLECSEESLQDTGLVNTVVSMRWKD